jgi:hypothetical protein
MVEVLNYTLAADGAIEAERAFGPPGKTIKAQ